MTTIPISTLVQVNPGVLSAAGTLNSLIGLILSEATDTPVGSIVPFPDAASVGAYYGLTSPEYLMAQVYFQGPDNALLTPATLYFAQYPAAAVSGFLRGANLGTMTLAQLQLLNGTLTITSNGTAETSASISLTGATSFSNAASLIAAGFTSPTFTVAYSAQHNAFVFTSTTTGVGSTMSFATGTLAEGLLLAADDGAVVSPGAAAATPAAFMAGIAAQNGNFNAFATTWEPSTSDATAFSAWTSTQNNQYVFVGFDTDPNVAVSGSTTTWGYAVDQANDGGTTPIYGTNLHAALVLGWIASLDFSAFNGRATLAAKTQQGLVPYVTDATTAANVLANGYNFYGAYAGGGQAFQMLQNGQVSGPYKWLDSYVDQIQLRTAIQLALVNLLVSAGSIPYNSAGYALIEAACADPINAAVNFGSIRTGVPLSTSQVQQLANAVGSDVSSVVQAQGYYLQILPAQASARIARTSPPIKLFYSDGGSIQTIAMSAIEIQ